MFKFISTNTLRRVKSSSSAARASSPPPHNLIYLLQTHPFSSSLKQSVQNSSNQELFTVNYLVNSCGFSPEKAISASKYVKFETPEKPDSVSAFFNNHGFTQTQISSIITKYPTILACDTQKTLLPKLEFLKSKGVSSADVARIIYASPFLLKRSLENVIIPSFNFYSNLLQSEEKTIAAIKRVPRVLSYYHDTVVAPNTEILQEAGVPNANIMILLSKAPRAFMISSDRFRQLVEDVENMGFHPSKMRFLIAVQALRGMTKPTWEKKVEVYKKWGWTKDQILVAFKNHPGCMMMSEDKINEMMDFYVNEMGWESSLFVRWPILLVMSLKKRIVPRCAVYQALLSKGLVKTKGISLTTLLEIPEKQFLTKFVNCYEEEAPELLKLYKEKLELAI